MGDKKWYGVHTYSGYENKVKLNLEERIRSLGAEDFFDEILIPSETVVELKHGEIDSPVVLAHISACFACNGMRHIVPRKGC